MTPVIVPGLAAKMFSGVSDRVLPPFPAGLSVVGLPVSIKKPIQHSTPPLATENASRETPNRWCRMRTPKSAARTRMNSTAKAAFAASAT